MSLSNIKTLVSGKTLILDDREDVLSSTSSLFESYDIPLIECKNIKEANSALQVENPNISNVFVDYKIKDENGMDFIIDQKIVYPYIQFYLMSGWQLSKNEEKKIKNNQIVFLEKGKLLPKDMIEMVINSDKESDNKTIDKISSKEEYYNLSEKYFINRLKHKATKKELFKYKNNWHDFTFDLIHLIKIDQDTEHDDIIIGDKLFSTEDIISEIESLTPLGKELVSLHNQYVTKFLKTKPKNINWFKKLFN